LRRLRMSLQTNARAAQVTAFSFEGGVVKWGSEIQWIVLLCGVGKRCAKGQKQVLDLPA
jgi:hypothetical protein